MITRVYKWFESLDRRLLFSIGSFGILVLYSLILPLNHYLAYSIHDGLLWRMGIPAMFGIYLAFCGMRDGTEVRILFGFWLWMLIVSFINGDRSLSEYADYYIDMSVMVLMFVPAILLCRKKREWLLEVSAFLIVLVYYVLGLICIYCAVNRTSFLNPIDQYSIGYHVYSGMGRITVFSAHPNFTAGHFFISLSMALWLILRRKNVLLRIFLGLSAVLSFISIALTVSRNGQTIAAIAVGLFVGILILEKLNSKPLPVRLTVLILSVSFIAAAAYMTNEPIRYALWKSHEVSSETTASQETSFVGNTESAVPLSSIHLLSSEEEYRSDDRGYFESGRKEIYWSAFKSLQMEPRRLLFGCRGSDVMRISNQLIREQAPHFHNIFLQIINEYGLIGLGLVLWFFVLMIHHGSVILLSADGRFSLDEKMLAVPVLCFLLYYQLEVGIFTFLDYITVFFFLACGMLTGCFHEKQRHLVSTSIGIEQQN